MNTNSILFYFPYYEVSGVPVLFLNLAEYLAEENPKLTIKIIDYENGYMSTNRKRNSKVDLIVFTNGKTIQITEGILIMQAILPYAMRPELKIGSNTKILFWNLFPDIFFPNVFPFNFFRKTAQNNLHFYQLFLNIFWRHNFTNLKDFVKEAIMCNTLHFMDISNLKRTEEILNLKLPISNYIPIVASSGNIEEYKEKKGRSTEINISWIGRLCEFKYCSVELIIKSLNKVALSLEKKITLFIVGDGPYMEYLQKLHYTNHFFRINFLGTIPKDELDFFLIKKIGINISMGTSALESARLHIPTIVVDYSYNSISTDYNFRWLHETKDYDLGHLITNNDIVPGNNSIETMLISYLEGPEFLGELSHKYYQQNHSIEIVAEKLITIIDNGIANFGDYDRDYFKKGFIRKIYEHIKYKL